MIHLKNHVLLIDTSLAKSHNNYMSNGGVCLQNAERKGAIWEQTIIYGAILC